MHYFKLPKLGSYIAIPLTYNHCLRPSSFSAALNETQLKIQHEESWKTKHEEYEVKKKEYLEQEWDLEELDKEFDFDEEEPFEEKPVEIEERKYVLCADTLGQDKTISEADRKSLDELVKFFAESWSQQESHELKKSIKVHMKYLKGLGEKGVEGFLEEYKEREDKANEEKEAEMDKDLEENEMTYQFDTARLTVQRAIVLERPTKKQFMNLAKYRVLSNSGILHQLLYFLGYTKEDINVPKTNILNWKHVKTLLNEDDFFKRIKSYNPVGPKGLVKQYAYVNRLSTKLEKMTDSCPQKEVDDYNLGYGRIYEWFKTVTSVRIQDIMLRRAQKQKLREEREIAIQDFEKWDEDRKITIENALADFEEIQAEKNAEEDARKAALEEQGVESGGEEDGDEKEKEKVEDDADAEAEQPEEEKFNEEDALRDWLVENPKPEIPPEVVDDVDEDYEDVDEAGDAAA